MYTYMQTNTYTHTIVVSDEAGTAVADSREHTRIKNAPKVNSEGLPLSRKLSIDK